MNNLLNRNVGLPGKTNCILCFGLLVVFSLANRYILAQEFGPQLGIGHQAGTAPGLADGFSNLGAFIPMRSVGDELLIFSDSHLLLFNDQSQLLGANIGVGLRRYNSQLNRIFGANVYYDLRQLPDFPSGRSSYHQIGFGLESMGEIFDFRVFANTPTSLDRQSVWATPNSIPQFGGANGQHIIYGNERFRQALGTFDLEGGALLLARDRYAISSYGGAYHLWGDSVSDWGARGRLELRVNDKLFVNGFLQHDPIFNTTGGVAVELRFGNLGSRPSTNYYMPSRLSDPVQRRRFISIYETDQELVYTNAGRAITVRHVSSDATPDGSGSIWSPNQDLAGASNQTEDIVYLHGGSIFENQQIVISRDGQRLLGEGVPHLVNSDQGMLLLPDVNPSSTTPQIQNSIGSPAVTINADNVEVSGVTVSSSLSGIYGDGVSEFDVNRNMIYQNGTGIDLRDLTGPGSIRENIVAYNQTNGISVAGNFAGEVMDNIASYNLGGSGVRIDGNFSGEFSGNTTNENSWAGTLIIGTVDGDIASNTAMSNNFEGLGVTNTVTGNVVNNIVSYNGRGLVLQFDVIGDIADNIVEYNGTGGIGVGNNVTGNVTNNQLIGNNYIGMHIIGTITGDILNNTATDNGHYGLLVSNSVIGNIAENRLESNGGGLYVALDVIGDVTDNVANNNTSFGGIGMQRNHQGILSRNTVNNNNYWGIMVLGDQIGDVEYNVSNNNGYGGENSFDFHGITIEGSFFGNLTANEANGNQTHGIHLSEGLFGNVVNNLANNNSAAGIRILQSVNGSFMGNTTNLNIGTGTWVSGNISLDFTNNTANLNGGNGLQVDGMIGGSNSPNSASGNSGIDHNY